MPTHVFYHYLGNIVWLLGDSSMAAFLEIKPLKYLLGFLFM